MQIRLYQSTKHPSTAILAAMLQKLLQRQSKALVRCASQAEAQKLSDFLWQQDGFIPHGIVNRDTSDNQPIWLTYDAESPNEDNPAEDNPEGNPEDNPEGNPLSADTLFLCNGLLPQIENDGKDSRFADIILPFDDHPQVVEKMQNFWRELQNKDLPQLQELTYWQNKSGKWQALPAINPAVNDAQQ